MIADSHILYEKFRTDRQHYVYDTYSNHILQVSEELWHALDRLLANGQLPARDEASAGPPPKGETAVDAVCLREIAEARAADYLRETRITGMRFADQESTLVNLIRDWIPQLSIEVTERCTSRCRYCADSYDVAKCQEPRDMDWRTASNAVDCFLAHSTAVESRCISFWGGEPLLNFSLMNKVFDYVGLQDQKRPMRYSFTTNASLITPAIARVLAAQGVQLLVSLDGPQEIHDRQRVKVDGRGTYAETMRGLRTLAESEASYYKSVWFNCVVAPGVDLCEVAQFFSSDPLLEGHRVNFTLVSGFRNRFFREYGRYPADQIAQFRRLMVSAFATPSASTRVFRDTALQQFARIARRPRSPVGTEIHPNGCCAPLRKKMHVAVDGSIHLCERVGPDNPVGNVNDAGIDDEAALNLTREYCRWSIADCQHCWAVRLCGACFRESMARGRWVHAGRVSRCEQDRAAMREGLQRYAAVVEERPDAFLGAEFVLFG